MMMMILWVICDHIFVESTAKITHFGYRVINPFFAGRTICLDKILWPKINDIFDNIIIMYVF